MKLKVFIGGRVREARLEKKLSQEQLSAVVNKSVETISNIETGRKLTSLDTLVLICKQLDKPLTFLFEGFEDVRKLKRARLDKEADVMRQLQQLQDTDLDLAMSLLKAFVRHRAG